MTDTNSRAEARGIWRLTVRDEFAAAHSLRNYGGKCEAVHGHNFQVAITVEGETLDPATEILVDFKELKQALKQVLQGLDHHMLNEAEPFLEANPSSENLARYIYRALVPTAEAHGVRMHEVTVSERGPQSATYREIPM